MRLLTTFASALLIIAGVIPGQVHAADVDLGKLLAETQVMRTPSGNIQLVWWIPTEYWQASLDKNSKLGTDQKEAFYEVVRDYIVLAVIEAKASQFGALTITPRDQVLANLSVTIPPGPAQLPLAETELSGDARNFSAMMKPILANALGQVGQGLEFYWFRGTDADGRLLLDPRKPGALEVSLRGELFPFRLPLGSLLPPTFDSETGEQFPGNYLYSPFTGKRLTDRPSGAKP